MICSHLGCKLLRQRDLREVYRRSGKLRDLLAAIFCVDGDVECRGWRVDQETGEILLHDIEEKE